MPRAKAASKAAPAAKKARGPKAHALAETFPNGEILKDTMKKEWRLGDVIGQGGFGLIYKASDKIGSVVNANAEYVVKIEPVANGPLFCELHFYQRAAKPNIIDDWIKQKKLKYLPVPKLCGAGTHNKNSKTYRFLVIPRYSTDLQKLFESNGKSFSHKAVYSIGLRMIDALEYMHENDYVHADIKAANILLGYKDGKVLNDQIFLVDFGLAFKYVVDGKHKEYKEDPRKAHDGTVEFTSRDAHNGVSPSRRADIEILGYCLLQWLCGVLPWENKLDDKDYVRDAKIKYMKDIPTLMKKCFPDGDAPDVISTFLTAVAKLKYDDKPNYTQLRQILRQGLNKVGVKDEWKLNLSIDGSNNNVSPKKRAKSPKKAAASPAPKKATASPAPKKATASPAPKKDTGSPAPKRKAASPAPNKKGTKRKSEDPQASTSDSPSKQKKTSGLTPAQRQILAKMNGNSKPSPSSRAKKSAPAPKVTKKSPEKPSVKSPSSGKRQRKTINYVDDESDENLFSEEDEDRDLNADDFSEDEDFEPSPKKSRASTPSRAKKSTTDERSPAKESASKNGTKRVVRRKKINQVDAESQTSPAVTKKKKR
ncbi:serine/threonine-protein kinase VRK1 isoform X2 [Patella vulgata]|nr:serine/threonine-protein kinase VRK1 isoform X2 [Patella vulgata]XP_050404328.1 serine/threonine-protein kinase VRK1 isoform X2 [Patella vulgata]XP_050404329.1 serine/threonine-protein kinase VRK1 isoform X2 [Patella vulgata]